MLHARYRGESFGLAIAEFLLRDRPVLCWEGGRDRNHLFMQPERGNIYRRFKDLLARLLTLAPVESSGGLRQAAVEAYRPAMVARQFVNAFYVQTAAPIACGPALRLKRRLVNRANLIRHSMWASV